VVRVEVLAGAWFLAGLVLFEVFALAGLAPAGLDLLEDDFPLAGVDFPDGEVVFLAILRVLALILGVSCLGL
jgi:hypothetical protein